MEFLSTFLPIILYIVAIVLLVILIILGLRLLKLLDKVDVLVDNIEEKVNTFNGALSVVKTAADGIASISDSVLFGISSAVSKVFNRFTKKKEDDLYE